MGRCRFEKTDLVRLALSDGDWIEVRRRLSAGETRRMASQPFRQMQGAGISVDFAVLGMARMKAYIKDWSFVDANDKRVPVTDAAIEALDKESMAEIEEALDKHVTEVEESKKIQTTETTSSPELSVAGTSDGPGRSTNELQTT